MGWNGHFWTIAPRMGSWLTRTRTPAGERPWHLDLDDPEAGRVRLPGRLADPGNGTLLILVHGLGGSIDSPYMLRFAHAAAGQGLATLRLGLRGSDRQGGDFYHAGLSGDLETVVASPGLAGFEHLWIVGFSLGGHLTLRFGTHVDDPRVRAVVGICAPIDLDACVRDFDQPEYWLYRRYILHGLRTMVGAMGDDAPVDHPAALGAIKLLRDWDSKTVVPRFGFESAEDYYRQAGVVHRLAALRRPALLVASEGDPIVSVGSIRRAVEGAPDHLRVVISRRGGHVGFPPDLDLGLGPRPGLEEQVLSWLSGAQSEARSDTGR